MKVVGKPDGTTPTVGDKVTFLCGAVQGATEYQIRLFTPSGGHQRLELREPENGVARASKPFTIQQSGEYLAQCRICVSGNCQDWEEVPPRFKQPQDGQAVYQATTSLEGDTGPTVPSSEESETKTLPTEPEPTGIMKPIPTPVTQEESSETSKDTLETSRLENQNPGPVAPSPTADSTEEIKQ
jgi:hypothetical protein